MASTISISAGVIGFSTCCFDWRRTSSQMSSPPRAATSGPLIERQDLPEHAGHRLGRQHARRQLHLAPGERSTEFVGRFRRRDDVRLLADVHDEGVTIESDDRVE
jgi:hypothetical protein